MNLRALMVAYKVDADSPYRTVRYNTRCGYDSLMRRLDRGYGALELSQIRLRDILAWHREWSEGGKLTAAHALIGMLRTLVGFGATVLEDGECARLSVALHGRRFPMAQPRTESLTLEQANDLRQAAHDMGLHSVALCQAFQWDCMLRQRDVIGAWEPETEPGESDIHHDGMKWLRGLRWESISHEMILTHVTSKRQKKIVVDLKLAPMVMAELDMKPRTGPIIICERTARPYFAHQFRYFWRQAAREAGIPENVKNMDSRSGAISEATDAGVPLEHIRHLSTHGEVSMVARYSRNGTEKAAEVMRARIEHRNGTN